ncbi:hypothetical protein [Marinagarivorans algicola]
MNKHYFLNNPKVENAEFVITLCECEAYFLTIYYASRTVIECLVERQQ